MANPRPTFSGSWHRVAELRPRLRAGVRVTRQRFRGRLWYLFHDPSSTSHYRMSRPAYAFAGLLDGRRTVDEAWTIAAERLGDEAPTQDEAITVLGQMHSSSLLHADMPGDAELLLRRRTRTRQREARGYMMNILFARFRLADPDALLATLRPVLGPLFSVPGLIAWLALVSVGLVLGAVHWDRLIAESAGLIRPSNVLLLYGATVLGKLLHELAHGVACKQMARNEGAPESGSGVHAVGVMLLVFVPFPYIDASGAWTLRSRWRRAIVGAAGIFSDLALAAAAMVVWSRTAPGSGVHAFALNLAVVSSVSSILFNGNPLMRFDGYYILADLIGQPNLYQRSRETLMRLARRWLFGVREEGHHTVSRAETAGLAVYAAAAAVYRVMITAAIVALIATQWFAMAIPLAVLALVAFFVLPLGKFAGYLANSPQLARRRGRATAVSAGIAAALIVLVGVVPVPDRVRATGVVEPASATEVYADASGFVETVAPVSAGVAPGGAPLVTLANAELRARVESLEARLRAATLSRRRATGDDPAAALAYAEQESALRSQIEEALARLASLRVEAPARGVWLPASADLRPGVFVERATPLGSVIDPSRLRVRVPVRQGASGVVAASSERVEMRARGEAEALLVASRTGLLRADDRDGGAPFEVFVDLPADTALRAGRRVEVRFEAPARPIAAQTARAIRQTLQRAAGSTRARARAGSR